MVFRKGVAIAAFLMAFVALSTPVAFGQEIDSTAVDSVAVDSMTVDTEPVMDETSEADEPAGTTVDALNYANVTWAVGNIEEGISEFNALTDVTADRIHIIGVSTLVTAENQADFDAAVTASEAQQGSLHAMIDDSDVLEQAFDTAGVDHETVVGMDVLDDGNVVFFYNDQEGGQ